MIPLWLKVTHTVLALAVLAVYWRHYGPGNFLWFCQVALIGLIPALWLESALLVSMLAIAVLVPEMIWIAVLLISLVPGLRIHGVIDYMFDPARPLWLRAVSLYHLPLLVWLVWLVAELGYEPHALPLMAGLSAVILILSRLLPPIESNINWVHGPGGEGRRQTRLHPLAYLALVILVVLLALQLPAHLVLQALLG